MVSVVDRKGWSFENSKTFPFCTRIIIWTVVGIASVFFDKKDERIAKIQRRRTTYNLLPITTEVGYDFGSLSTSFINYSSFSRSITHSHSPLLPHTHTLQWSVFLVNCVRTFCQRCLFCVAFSKKRLCDTNFSGWQWKQDFKPLPLLFFLENREAFYIIACCGREKVFIFCNVVGAFDAVGEMCINQIMFMFGLV